MKFPDHPSQHPLHTYGWDLLVYSVSSVSVISFHVLTKHHQVTGSCPIKVRSSWSALQHFSPCSPLSNHTRLAIRSLTPNGFLREWHLPSASSTHLHFPWQDLLEALLNLCIDDDTQVEKATSGLLSSLVGSCWERELSASFPYFYGRLGSEWLLVGVAIMGCAVVAHREEQTVLKLPRIPLTFIT